MARQAILNLRLLIIPIMFLIISLQLASGNIFASSRSPDQDLKIQKAIEDTNSANEVTNNSIYAKDMVFGDKNAKILLIEYFAPTCATCRNYHLEVFPQIKSKYIDSGKIAYVMRECVGNRLDLDASILARCKGDTESYLKLIGWLLKEQDLWAYRKDYRDLLTKIAKDHGLTEPEYEACLANNGTIGIFFNYARAVIRDTDFIGTPSIYINGVLYNGEYSIEAISELIESMLTKREGNLLRSPAQ